jgi:hypothetical protein
MRKAGKGKSKARSHRKARNAALLRWAKKKGPAAYEAELRRQSGVTAASRAAINRRAAEFLEAFKAGWESCSKGSNEFEEAFNQWLTQRWPQFRVRLRPKIVFPKESIFANE